MEFAKAVLESLPTLEIEIYPLGADVAERVTVPLCITPPMPKLIGLCVLCFSIITKSICMDV